jgi:uncharacterized phage-associated protein
MITAMQVAAYFLSKVDDELGEGITNLKMQKLVYYAQAYHLAIFGIPLFGEEIQAWQHGPVVPDLYRKFKRFNSGPIDADDYLPTINQGLSEDVREFLDEVYEQFAQFSAWRLADMTHTEDPWKEAISTRDHVISHDSMRNFYKAFITVEA